MGANAPGRTTLAVEVGEARADAVTVDALARLRLVCARHDCALVLRGASPELLELVSFMGLAETLPAER
jgi:hypothetical protein